MNREGSTVREAVSVRPSLTDLEGLYRARRLTMVRLASVLTGSGAIAEEVVQEAFIQVGSHLDRVDDPSAYLRRVATNLCRSHLRRRQLEQGLPAPVEGVTGDPQIDETWSAVCKLPFRQRAVLVLRFYDDMAEGDIARVLECRVGTVKSSLHRGLAKLRQELRND